MNAKVISFRQVLKLGFHKRSLHSISSSGHSLLNSRNSHSLERIRFRRIAPSSSDVSFSSKSDNECFHHMPPHVASYRGHPFHGYTAKSYMLMSTREMSSMTDIVPEFAKNYSIWGGTAIIFQTLHAQNIPYWACMSLTSVAVRTALFPLVVKGAKTAVRNSKSAPEIQFVMSMFLKDNKKLKDANAPPSQRLQLWTALWQSARGIWKLYKVNPLDVLKSPMMQLPVFWYFSVDIRKLINGGNPELAQELTESGFLWVKDLTEPDPWHGLPILLGMMLYATVELSMGKHTLSGEAASKSNVARYLKDGFQGLAILMPCITANSPAGIQIYLLTSFTFTLLQSTALRHNPFRQLLGLPPKDAPPPDAVYVKEMILYSRLEDETYGILDPKRCYNFKPYEQILNADEFKQMEEDAGKLKEQMAKANALDGIGVYSIENQPAYEPSPASRIVNSIDQQINSMMSKKRKITIASDNITEISPSAIEVMAAANVGERPAASIKIAPSENSKEEETNFKRKTLSGKRKKRYNSNKGRK